jgi:hypothetical protein
MPMTSFLPVVTCTLVRTGIDGMNFSAGTANKRLMVSSRVTTVQIYDKLYYLLRFYLVRVLGLDII